MTASLSHLFVHVADVARSRAFYVDLLGLRLLEGGDGYQRIGGGDGFTMGMEERPAWEVGALGIEIEIAVDDVDEVHRRLTRAGATVDGPPADQDWGMRHVWLRDPDGYRLSIYSPVR
jgi:catechol 2,3-dioxygenase-like lactoylglutathione lyase family enzyme